MIFKIYSSEFNKPVPYKTKDELLSELYEDDKAIQFTKFCARSYICAVAHRTGSKTLLSMGTSNGASDYLLSLSISKLIAIDNSEVNIQRCKDNFPNITAIDFDFITGDYSILKLYDIDIAYFMGSSYVMTDDEYIQVLKSLNSIGVKYIIDFEPCLEYWQLPQKILGEIKNTLLNIDRVGFHGYIRTRNHYDKIFRESGWKVTDNTTVGAYNFVVTLKHA